MNRNTLQPPGASTQNTKRRVQQELIDMGIQPNTVVTKDELFVILDRKVFLFEFKCSSQCSHRSEAKPLIEELLTSFMSKLIRILAVVSL